MNTDKIMFEPNTGCHIWTGNTGSAGYGRVFSRKGGKPMLTYAHRLAYVEAFGSIPAGKQINHKCDNPLCVNPAHLYAGTQQDNLRDMRERGRHTQTSGEGHSSAKLNEASVREIRASGKTCAELSVIYGVSAGQISRVKNRKDWRNVA